MATRYRTAPARPAVRYRRAQALVVVAVAAVLAGSVGPACSPDGGDGSPAPPDPSGPAGTDPQALAVREVAVPEPGHARVVLGGDLDATLAVITCLRDLAAQPDGQVPSEQVVVEARGEAAGAPLSLDVRRYRSQGASPTITDTVRIVHGPPEAPTRVVEAQRFEVDGLVTDPRDPTADDQLLVVSDERIEVRALFAPPGAFAEDGGLIEGLVHIACAG